MATSWTTVAVVLIGSTTISCATVGRAPSRSEEAARAAVIARSRVWTPVDVGAMNLKAGPRGAGAFAPGAVVRCAYQDKELEGKSPKFLCRIGQSDEVLVKYGSENGEVYGEVLTSRLLWALGFVADSAYPVTVICRGCPSTVEGTVTPAHERRVDSAVIKRRAPGREWKSGDDEGWSWQELALVDPEAGGAPRSHRDALTLLAVMLQHTDSKPEQQRILCTGRGGIAACRRPFLMISDVGLTFGAATMFNSNDGGSVNLERWRKTPIWRDEPGCVGNISKSFTGTLEHPAISEEGRSFLSRLLVQLSDRQLRDLFEVARVTRRLRSPSDPNSGFGTVGEWVDTFKEKRTEVASRRCA